MEEKLTLALIAERLKAGNQEIVGKVLKVIREKEMIEGHLIFRDIFTIGLTEEFHEEEDVVDDVKRRGGNVIHSGIFCGGDIYAYVFYYK
jgi:hypothetical protein